MLDEWRRATIMPTDISHVARPKMAADETSGEDSAKATAGIRKFDEDYETDDTSGSIKVYKPDFSYASGLPMEMLILKYPFVALVMSGEFMRMRHVGSASVLHTVSVFFVFVVQGRCKIHHLSIRRFSLMIKDRS